MDNGNIDERRATVNIRAEGGGVRRQRRSQRQSAVPQHVLSRVQRAGVRVERLGAARAARPGCQRHHRRHADRRQSGGHAAEPRRPARASTSRRGWRRATPTPTCYPVIRPSRSGAPPASRSGTSSYEHLIAVNQVGKRFYNEMDLARRYDTPGVAGRAARRRAEPFAQARPVRLAQLPARAWVKQMYNGYPAARRRDGDERGLAGAELLLRTAVGDLRQRHGRARQLGHQAAVHRQDNGYFFSADTIDELAQEDLRRATNSSGCRSSTSRTRCASGTPTWTRAAIPISDAARTRRCTRSTSRRSTPPRSARSGTTPMAACGSTARRQVLDTQGAVIPGLYSGGEASGGGNQHGLGRCPGPRLHRRHHHRAGARLVPEVRMNSRWGSTPPARFVSCERVLRCRKAE